MGPTEEQMVEAIRRQNAAINSGDFDRAIELADPDIVFVRTGGLPELRGAEAVRAWMEPDAFESQATELLSIETGDNRVLTRQFTRARGAGSGIEMELESLGLWTFNDEGRVSRVELFLLADEADARRKLRGE
jgi:ketosteroid isomerase-like protein